MSTKFDSEGFDLSATTTATASSSNLIYEIGGGVSSEEPPTSFETKPSKTKPPEPTSESERLKERGNEFFKAGNHLEAYDYYTMAIEACPYGEAGPKGDELLRLKREFEEEKLERNRERHRREMERRRSGKKEEIHDDDKKEEKRNKEEKREEFLPPRHIYGHKLSIYHANRAAALLHTGRLEECIDDCDISILYNPNYAKAYSRRSAAHERNDDTEAALNDARRASELEPSNPTFRKNAARLQKIEEERMEKLKEETMGKLKDLGNSILGNFGLSLDNFQAVQDPKTGGYSISFNQNK